MNGKTLISAHIGGMIRLWDAELGKERTSTNSRRRMSRVSISPNGRTLAFIEDKDRHNGANLIRLWDMAAGREIDGIPETAEAFFDEVAFAPDGKSLAAIEGQIQLLCWISAVANYSSGLVPLKSAATNS